MEIEINNFIGVFKKAIPVESCEEIINYYNFLEGINKPISRQELENCSTIHKDTNLVFLDDARQYGSELLLSRSELCLQIFCEALWPCYEQYASSYPVIKSLSKHILYNDVKIQKTKPGQAGYSIWHCEQDTRNYSSRLLLVIAYLNNVEEGGETEFLHQSKRIKPEQGTVMICPGSFTHTHRGNPPISNDKYIANGWIEFCQ
jgi:hypothetical protein